MQRILSVLVVVLAVLLAVGTLVACGEGVNDERAIEDTIEGYVETYNSQDFVQCLTYFSDYGNEADALAFLAYMRSISGELELVEVKDILISYTTASATVVFIIAGEESTDQMQLRQVNSKWKILWGG
jgi:galactitol-specific phosphotransferase system IIB component